MVGNLSLLSTSTHPVVSKERGRCGTNLGISIASIIWENGG